MKKSFLIGIIFMIGLTSCNSLFNSQIEISGLAVNQTDNLPLSGYEINLIEIETPSTPFSNVNRQVLESVVSDDNGIFSFSSTEIRKRNRFEYIVEFNENNEMFYPEEWQRGTYSPVNGSEIVTKGEDNQIELSLVKTGGLNFFVVNQSLESRLIECTVSNDKFELLQFTRILEGQEEFSYDVFTELPAGKLSLTWQVGDSNNYQIIIEEIDLGHNQQMTHTFTD